MNRFIPPFPLAFSSPAKINLFLAVTQRRSDGFHDLVSVAAPLVWGDTLTVTPAPEFTLECNDPAVPTDESNLVLKAARAFRAESLWQGGAHFRLGKRVPMGAGLGGGSSNAVAALRALNRMADQALSEPALAGLAAKLGSDCALFLQAKPVIMRGRGERIEPLPPPAAARLSNRRILVFKPSFGIATPWAYAQLAAQGAKPGPAISSGSGAAPRGYLSAVEAEARLAAWIGAEEAPAEKLLFNSFESVAFAKYPALPVLLEALRADFGLAVGMSGSGSACFALLPENSPEEKVAEIRTAIRAAWGEEMMVIETSLA